MLLVDPRSGSKDYIPILRALGATVEPVTLEYGDVAFWASGRAIGIELKKLADVLQCIVTGRLAGHQLPGMIESYNEIYLIVEGLWRPNPTDGVLEHFRGGWTPVRLGARRPTMFRDLDSYLTTLEVKGGLRVKRTASSDETARTILSLYSWWQDFDGHRSHLALNRAGRDGAIFYRPTFARRVAAELPGVGYERSADVAIAFPTVRDMVSADESAWRRVPGIGKKLAKGIVEAWDSAT